jgi:L-ascorbate metabolism protein UlaG (beta-lactamase superfamily)
VREAMGANGMFLRPNVKMELLACNWFAWSHLISPVQHAMNVAFRYLPMMQSFVSNPQIHVAASNDPKLFGGPFLDLPGSAVPAVSRLIGETNEKCSKLVAFAKDLKAFGQAIQSGAKGYSLCDFYDRIPPSLAGAIEIAYDVNNNPELRIIEEVVYKYNLDNRHTQEIRLSSIPDSERKFFLSTPRLSCGEAFSTKMPFSDPRLDTLAAMRLRPDSLDDMASALEVDGADRERFEGFFTSEAPRRKDPNYTGQDVRVRYFGHACVLIQSARTSILIDPTVTWDPDEGDGRFTFSDLPDVIDFLVISHNHQDHFSPEMLVQLRHRVRRVVIPRNRSGSIADPSMKLVLRQLGYDKIDMVDAFDSIEFEDGEIVSLPFSGEHADLAIHSKQTILVKIKGRRFFFLVDSDAIDPGLYRLVADIVGKVDALFVGMECYGAPLTWLYGPLLTRPISRRDDESRRLSASNCERAWRLVKGLGCSKAFIYAMGQEPWLRYLMGLEYQPECIQLKQAQSFFERCREIGVAVEHLHIAREMLY